MDGEPVPMTLEQLRALEAASIQEKEDAKRAEEERIAKAKEEAAADLEARNQIKNEKINSYVKGAYQSVIHHVKDTAYTNKYVELMLCDQLFSTDLYDIKVSEVKDDVIAKMEALFPGCVSFRTTVHPIRDLEMHFMKVTWE